MHRLDMITICYLLVKLVADTAVFIYIVWRMSKG